MKILCLSLLRLGDIIQHRQLVRAVMAQHPQAEVHILCHLQFSQAQDLFSERVKFHFIPYQDLQKILVEQRQNPKAAFEMLENALKPLKQKNFQLLYDFTHTFFSDTVRKYLAIPQAKRNTRWKTYLEDHATVTGGSRFHLMEILAKSMNLEISPLKKSNSAREKIIVLQALTSDVKKNWALQNFQQLITKIQSEFSGFQIRVLASPSEVTQLNSHFTQETLFVSSMKQAQELLRKASLLISLDTSLLHLAAQEDCSVVGIFLGGADPIKTGPLLDRAILLHGKSSCAPCYHANPCHQPRHLCEDFISVDQVFTAVQQQLLRQQGKGSDMLPLAERVIFKQNAYSLRDVKITPLSIEKIFEELLWRYYLDGTWREELPRINSEARQFMEEISSVSMELKLKLVRRQKTLASEFQLCRAQLEEMMQKTSFLCIGQSDRQAQHANDLREGILNFVNNWEKQFSEQKDLFHRLQLILQEEVASAFELYRRMKSPFEEFQCLAEIRQQFADQLERMIENQSSAAVEV